MTSTTEGDLAEALRNREFIMHCQPKFSLVTNEIVGAEVLVRWRLPDGTLSPPALGHELGVNVVAEGVEAPVQQAFLAEAGCRLVQGYLVGMPLPWMSSSAFAVTIADAMASRRDWHTWP